MKPSKKIWWFRFLLLYLHQQKRTIKIIIMDDKLIKANEHIEELIDLYLSTKREIYKHCCLRVVLLNKKMKNCDNIDCDSCNQKIIEKIRTELLKEYIVS